MFILKLQKTIAVRFQDPEVNIPTHQYKLNSDSLENQDIKDFFNDTISYEDEVKDIKIITKTSISLIQTDILVSHDWK